jgi:hypothetical protein
MGLRCKRCGSEEHVKNGLMRNKQRYLCKVSVVWAAPFGARREG